MTWFFLLKPKRHNDKFHNNERLSIIRDGSNQQLKATMFSNTKGCDNLFGSRIQFIIVSWIDTCCSDTASKIWQLQINLSYIIESNCCPINVVYTKYPVKYVQGFVVLCLGFIIIVCTLIWHFAILMLVTVPWSMYISRAVLNHNIPY